jgi:hypothetical protein
VTVLIFHHKVLREQLQHHAVLAKLYLPGAIQRAIDIALLTVVPPKPTTAASIESCASDSAWRKTSTTQFVTAF